MVLIKACKTDNFYGAQLEPDKIENEIAQTTVFTFHIPCRSPIIIIIIIISFGL